MFCCCCCNCCYDQNDSNSIKDVTCSSPKEYIQYNSNENIICYYREDIDFYNTKIIFINDTYGKTIGRIQKIIKNGKAQYIFKELIKDTQFYVEKSIECCTENYTFFDQYNEIDGVVKISSGFWGWGIQEYDKCNSNINNGKMKQDICLTFTYDVKDSNGNPNFIAKVYSNICCTEKLKIYDDNGDVVKLDDKTIFNNGFTKIQLAIIIRYFYSADEIASSPSAPDD